VTRRWLVSVSIVIWIRSDPKGGKIGGVICAEQQQWSSSSVAKRRRVMSESSDDCFFCTLSDDVEITSLLADEGQTDERNQNFLTTKG